MITQLSTANAVGGKTARACENCLKHRASWLCLADDAFLCHTCDSSVHSANELASRHKRVHLAIASWHQGFTKKARTPRNPKVKPSYNSSQMSIVVPEVSNDECNGDYLVEENDENNENDDLIFSVPIFEFHDNGNKNDDDDDGVDNVYNICSFPRVKNEEEGESANNNDHSCFNWSIDVESDLNYSFVNDESQVSGVQQEEENKVVVPKNEDYYCESNNTCNFEANKRRKILLRLNYEEVISAWATLGCSSPWTTGRCPEFDLDHDGWPNCMGALSSTGVRQHGLVERIGGRGNLHIGGGKGREARVSRYREKKRTRLFSKKIRYEVRKLNAENRPRLKGRFVKRTYL